MDQLTFVRMRKWENVFHTLIWLYDDDYRMDICPLGPPKIPFTLHHPVEQASERCVWQAFGDSWSVMKIHNPGLLKSSDGKQFRGLLLFAAAGESSVCSSRPPLLTRTRFGTKNPVLCGIRLRTYTLAPSFDVWALKYIVYSLFWGLAFLCQG